MAEKTLPHHRKRVRTRRISPSQPPASSYHPVYSFRPCEAPGCYELHTGGDDGQSRYCPECNAQRGAA